MGSVIVPSGLLDRMRKSGVVSATIYQSDNANNTPRRFSTVMTADGRVLVQDFDFASEGALDVPTTAPKQKPSVATVLADKDFQLACLAAGIEISRRQASKFRKGQGLAYAAHQKRKLVDQMNEPVPTLEGRAPRPLDDEEV